MAYPGEYETMVLLAVLRLGPNAYAIRIAEELDERANRQTSRGTLYAALDRLEAKGLLEWTLEDAGPERGGHPRRCFALTPAGVLMTARVRSALVGLWTGVEDALDAALEANGTDA